MKDWLETLEARERLFVYGGAAVVVVTLIYVFIWAPLDQGQKNLQSSVAVWERSLAQLRPLRGMRQVSGSGPRVTAAALQQTPVVIVDQSLRARGLDRSLQRSQPTTSDGISVEFEGVAFDDLVLWLNDLSTQYAMNVSSGSLSAASRAGPGRINARLTLERAP